MEKGNRLTLLVSMFLSLVVGAGSAIMAAEKEVVVLADNATSQVMPTENATANVKKTATTASVKKQTRQVTGLVTAISGNHLDVKKGNKTFALKVEEGIVIKSGDTEKSLADLKVGDKIMAKYVESGGVLIARSIYLKIDAGK